MYNVETHRTRLDEIVSFFQQDIASLRTGRATPSLVEQIQVEAYGVKNPLLQLASITTPDARTIVIQPWDKNILKDIERAILAADINTPPVVDGELIRISMPMLTEENRKELVKVLHKKLEQARVQLRQQRAKIKDDILAKEKAGEVTEDERYQAQKKLDELIREYSDKIKEHADAKEKEIMTV